MPAPAPAKPRAPTQGVAEHQLVAIMEAPGAAVAQLSSALEGHKRQMQRLAEAENAALSRAYALEQLCARLSEPPSTLASPVTRFVRMCTAADSSSSGADTPLVAVTNDEVSGLPTLHTWLPFPRSRTPPSERSWMPQCVQLNGDGLSDANLELYRSLAEAMIPQASRPRRELAGAHVRSYDPFLTPEGTELIDDDGDQDDCDSVVSVPAVAHSATNGASTTLTAQSGEHDALDPTPPNSFAKMAYAPPSLPIPPASLSDEEDDGSAQQVTDDRAGSGDDVSEHDRPGPTYPPPHTASVTIVGADQIGDTLSASSASSSVCMTAHEDLPAKRDSDGGTKNDADGESEPHVQPSPAPREPTRHPDAGALTQRTRPPEHRSTPSPVQRELDAFFPAPLTAGGGTRYGDLDTAPATPLPPRKGGVGNRGTRAAHGTPIGSAADLLATIPTVPAASRPGRAAARALRNEGEKTADGRRAAGARNAHSRHTMRAVAGLEQDGVGHVRTKRRREADYGTEQRMAREDAELREGSASHLTPPCTPSIYWDTTMPTPYRK